MMFVLVPSQEHLVFCFHREFAQRENCAEYYSSQRHGLVLLVVWLLLSSNRQSLQRPSRLSEVSIISLLFFTCSGD